MDGRGRKRRDVVYGKETEVQVSHDSQGDSKSTRVAGSEGKGILNRRADDQIDRPGIERSSLRPESSFPPVNPDVHTLGQILHAEMQRDEGKRHRRSYSISFSPSRLNGPWEPSRRRAFSWSRGGRRKDEEEERNQTKTIRTFGNEDLDIREQGTPRGFSPYTDALSSAGAQIKWPSPEFVQVGPRTKWRTSSPPDVPINVSPRPTLRVQGASRRGSRRTVSDPILPTTARLKSSFNEADIRTAVRSTVSELDGKDRHTIVRMLKDELSLTEDGERDQIGWEADIPKAASDGNDYLESFDDIGRTQTQWNLRVRPYDAQRDVQWDRSRRSTSLDKELPRLPTLPEAPDDNRRGGQPFYRSRAPAVTQPDDTGSFQARRRTKSFERNDVLNSERTRGELSDGPSFTVTTRAATPMPCPSSSVSLLLASALLSQQASQILLELSSVAQASGRSDSAQPAGETCSADDMSELKRKLGGLAREANEAGRGLLDCLINNHSMSPEGMAGSAPGVSSVPSDSEAQNDVLDSGIHYPRTRWKAGGLASVIFPQQSPGQSKPFPPDTMGNHEAHKHPHQSGQRCASCKKS